MTQLKKKNTRRKRQAYFPQQPRVRADMKDCSLSDIKIRFPRRYNTTVRVDEDLSLGAVKKKKPNMSEKKKKCEIEKRQNRPDMKWSQHDGVAIVLRVMCHSQVKVAHADNDGELAVSLVYHKANIHLHEGDAVRICHGKVEGFAERDDVRMSCEEAIKMFLSIEADKLSETYALRMKAKDCKYKSLVHHLAEVSLEKKVKNMTDVKKLPKAAQQRRLERGLELLLSALKSKEYLFKSLCGKFPALISTIKPLLAKMEASSTLALCTPLLLGRAVIKDFLCGMTKDPACDCPLPFEMMDSISSFMTVDTINDDSAEVDEASLMKYLFINRPSAGGIPLSHMTRKHVGSLEGRSGLCAFLHLIVSKRASEEYKRTKKLIKNMKKKQGIYD